MQIPCQKVNAAIAAAVLLSLPFSCTPSPAEEIIFSTRSYHFQKHNQNLIQQDSNNNNWGAHYVADNGFTIGAYRNSYYAFSSEIGYSFPLGNGFGMSLGFVSGYERPIHRTPYIAWNYHQKIDKNWSAVYTVGALEVINLGFAYRWDKLPEKY